MGDEWEHGRTTSSKCARFYTSLTTLTFGTVVWGFFSAVGCVCADTTGGREGLEGRMGRNYYVSLS